MAFFEDLRSCDIPLSTIIDELYCFFPNLERNEIRFFYHGTFNVFVVKNHYIIRVPDKAFRNQEGVNLILNEVKMLNHIRKYVSVPIPDPIYLSTDPDCPFMGYEIIEGVPLHKCSAIIPREKKLNISVEIGEFLTELHSKKLYRDVFKNNILKNNFSCESYKKNLEQYFEIIQKSLFSLLNESQKQWINCLFTNFLDNHANFKFNFSVIHGDFDTSNILVDPHNFKITGIVDFEESRIYDRAADFLFYEEGNNFLQNIIANYKGAIDKNFEERMKFLYGISCLGYLSFGMEHHQPDMINFGFQLLKERMDRISY